MSSFKFTNHKPQVMRQWNLTVERILHVLGMLQNHFAQQEMDILIYNAPVSESGYKRTGRLGAGMNYEVDLDTKSVQVGNNVIYAIFVTMGTRFMVQLPFMQNSINNYQVDYRNIVVQILQEDIG